MARSGEENLVCPLEYCKPGIAGLASEMDCASNIRGILLVFALQWFRYLFFFNDEVYIIIANAVVRQCKCIEGIEGMADWHTASMAIVYSSGYVQGDIEGVLQPGQR